MKRRKFIQAVQSRVARIAVGASTVRGRGNSGVVAAARKHLRHIDLARFGTEPRAYRRALDRETLALLAVLPKAARHWGLARKLLKIFLRDCFYTTYLSRDFNLRRAQGAFEASS